MRTFLLLTLLHLLVVPGQDGTVVNDGSPVTVLAFKWSRSRQTGAEPQSASVAPAPTVIASDKNFERNVRVLDPAARDPKLDTPDGRRDAMEKSVQEARTPKAARVDGFAYRVKVQNSSAKVIEVIFWEYQFIESSDSTKIARRQFLCGVNIKPKKEKELQAFGTSGPSNVVSADSLAGKSASPYQEKAVINRVEYSDGTIWQRKDWSFAEVKASVARVTGTPWGAEMCRGL
ncbi:MAG TPA: hypothetical protein VJS44_09895 [Pyrinomonadaceae bacterium]|nr:hypothetical protein [Pyrinomonadaceae bacterium]